MKERLLTGWTFVRVIYVALGAMVIMQGLESGQWLGVAFGGYFAAMGLFGFGCAGGNCYGGNCTTTPEQKSDVSIEDVKFEEVKIKSK